MNDKVFRYAPILTGLIGIITTGYGYFLHRCFSDNESLVWLLIGLLNLVGGVMIGFQYRHLYLLSTKDTLTGLNNRRLMYRRFDTVLKKAARQGTELTLLLIDIDNFKTINDTSGHAIGDLVLKQVSEILHQSVRFHDLLFRWGGEEFAILLSGIPMAKALEIAERTRRRIEQHLFICGGSQLKITVSIGVYASRQTNDIDQIFKAADQALYQAKKSRNTVSVWQP